MEMFGLVWRMPSPEAWDPIPINPYEQDQEFSFQDPQNLTIFFSCENYPTGLTYLLNKVTFWKSTRSYNDDRKINSLSVKTPSVSSHYLKVTRSPKKRPKEFSYGK